MHLLRRTAYSAQLASFRCKASPSSSKMADELAAKHNLSQQDRAKYKAFYDQTYASLFDNDFIRRLDSSEKPHVGLNTLARMRQLKMNSDIRFILDYSYDASPSSENTTEKSMMRLLLFSMNLLLGYLIVTKYQEFLKSVESSSEESSELYHIIKSEPEKSEEKEKLTFSDIKGINEYREELKDLVDYIKNADKYQRAGGYIPKGVLLSGPPGTGKTLLARAIASEADIPFHYRSGSSFDQIYVGVGKDRVQQLFATARRSARLSKSKAAIIFIDEIDSIASSRENQFVMRDRQTLNQLLTEMDGINSNHGLNIIVIGATNIPEALDKAVMRSGRFDKTIKLPLPDQVGRLEILEYYLGKAQYSKKGFHLQTLVQATTGFSGAGLKNLVNVALLHAVKNNRQEAIYSDFEWALDRVTMGVGRKSMFVSQEEKLMTAFHEGGHALVNLLSPSPYDLHKVTILPRGGALGFTAMLPTEDGQLMNKTELLAQIRVALGGRVAEELVYGDQDITTGCSSDMQGATKLAYNYLRNFGMEDKHLLVRDSKQLSEEYNKEIDFLAQGILRRELQKTREILSKNRDKLDALAHQLVQKETMAKKEILDLLHL